MKIHSFFWFPAVLASLAFATSVKAEEVSTKAADLMGVSTDNQDSSNLLAQSSDPSFTITSPTTGSAPLYTGGDNSQLPASNYFYLGASVGRAFPGDINAKGKFTDAATIRFLQNQRIPNESENNLGLYSGNQWNIAGGYQWDNVRAELEIGSSSFGFDVLKPVPGKLDFERQIIATSDTKPTSVTGNLNVTTALFNAYYHLSSSKFSPYVGAGIGLGFISSEPNPVSVDNGTSFAYQAKLGAQYEVVKKGNIFAEFKYLGLTGYTSNKNDLELKLGSSNVYGFSVGYRQGL
ncbi:outer membrane protein [Cylindrospermopsis raciborskii UAM/DH-BiRr]|uniref:outer membrane protein n=1 Tax=Cylindrospermopsis raciborskii TaxID=77022 RepID=UPI00387915BD